ncbi:MULTISPECIES: class I SAM-dependent methyltransferase [Streptomyces]|uniref:restriction endonuclease n=1 Tax=Streptomyces TaxID=1883 RepID=UPI002E76EAEA|nr:restriction endonuclease [Streptomyces sp. JV181]MEE1780422.1 restriction endonuclease [Streptomyces sp. JV181]
MTTTQGALLYTIPTTRERFGREPVTQQSTLDLGVTFRDNRNQAVHSWYPYVEGFSADYVRQKLIHNEGVTHIYDPFGGSGTVQVVASHAGVNSSYSEINPFMSFVAETKVNAARAARKNQSEFQAAAKQFLKHLQSDSLEHEAKLVDLSPYHEAFPKRDFFEEDHLRMLLAIKDLAYRISDGRVWLRDLLLLATASNAVASSHMTRRADLRRRRANEYVTRVVNVRDFVHSSITQMVRDISMIPDRAAPMAKLSEDCRDGRHGETNQFDLAITSPPYLNGTNYFRNTKIELWLLDFIKVEKELPGLCRKAVTAGINNVSKTRNLEHTYQSVEEVASALDVASPDKRIPLLVRQYFSDMTQVFQAVQHNLKPGGQFIFDIGDSKFYGVHVPTDRLLVQVAERVGFEVVSDEVIARRYSRDRSALHQVEIIFRKG